MPIEVTQAELVDAYCERQADGLTAEPVNVISSVAFVVAALILLRKASAVYSQRMVWDLWLLISTLAAIGAGSVTWHLFARSWAELTDILPITLFINVFLVSFLLRIAKLKIVWVMALLMVFQLFNYAVAKTVPTEFLNGSMFYAPAWTALLLVIIYLAINHHPLLRSYILAVSLLTLSIVFRSIDLAVCTAMPVGTHFLWHLINAVVLYLLVAGLIYQLSATEKP